ncbi:histidine phosphatase family protein [Brevundimonas sp.]|uniref:histidine phosphatase family protein n=1 Tax=Brevundimonas sp. TaxID=1871086 RepID=UPI002731DEAB|nr:histidine phosphatase family protein [Brevundimonas sp.]MDP1911832.1 histidine phosphatase family protein [Brevundimonas sp.]
MAQTVVLVRHAEKADASADPALSEAGQARAEALAALLADRPPTMIMRTPPQRTGLTAQPLLYVRANGRRPDLVITPFEGRTVPEHVQMIAGLVREQSPDAIILIVGHSNTVPLIARALGYRDAADMPDCEYDRMTVLVLNGDHTTAVIDRYGEPANCE